MNHEDLSEKHFPVCEGLFPTPHVAVDKYSLSNEQIEFFHANGYLKGVRILDDTQIDVLRQELERLLDPSHPGRDLFYEYNTNESGDPNKVLFHALGAWRVSPAFHDLLWHPAMTVPASELLASPVRFWHDQLFIKPAEHGGVVIWHQDHSYWTRTKPMAHLTCWIGLDDSTLENGCLHYVPRSHKWNLLPRENFANDMDKIREFLTDEQLAEFEPVPIELRKGECSFHHPLMVHGSFANTSEKPRRGVVINFVADGVVSDSNEPLLDGVPVIPKGEKLAGRFFPMLYAQQN